MRKQPAEWLTKVSPEPACRHPSLAPASLSRSSSDLPVILILEFPPMFENEEDGKIHEPIFPQISHELIQGKSESGWPETRRI